ncbi:hypothetical protein AURDEDRAFT_177092 [Auricularia subglabra TFB-10046 SS5]|uniref:Uncharacterized protein n=1 Tax=Auricularia subglabra (strain TFB-10046 / SS5) TaxID=717982 RepID=J0WPN0_AURST|nr:hypothetical protein AURDEDRAFT_177092 [Auricularia subglabra TFB-10046 SS5]
MNSEEGRILESLDDFNVYFISSRRLLARPPHPSPARGDRGRESIGLALALIRQEMFREWPSTSTLGIVGVYPLTPRVMAAVEEISYEVFSVDIFDRCNAWFTRHETDSTLSPGVRAQIFLAHHAFLGQVAEEVVLRLAACESLLDAWEL